MHSRTCWKPDIQSLDQSKGIQDTERRNNERETGKEDVGRWLPSAVRFPDYAMSITPLISSPHRAKSKQAMSYEIQQRAWTSL